MTPPVHDADCHFCQLGFPIDVRSPEHHINPETQVWPIAEWGSECGRGFVSDLRFGPGKRLIKRTNRKITRRWRKMNDRHQARTLRAARYGAKAGRYRSGHTSYGMQTLNQELHAEERQTEKYRQSTFPEWAAQRREAWDAGSENES